MYRVLCIQSGLFMISTLLHLSGCQDWSWMGGDKMTDRLSTDSYPGGRSGSSLWSYNGTVWMFGGNGFSDLGSGKSHLLNDVWSFDIHTNKFKLHNPGSWALRSDPALDSAALPQGRQHAAMCGHLDKIVVFGGCGEGGRSLEDSWIYHTSSRKWSELIFSNDSSAGPAARGHSSVWCYDRSIYLFGGMNDKNTVFADMWKLNLSSLIWTKLYSHGESRNVSNLTYPAGRNGAVTWNSGDVLYMFGGNTNPLFSYTVRSSAGLTSDLWRYHPRNYTWQFVSGVTRPDQESAGYRRCSNIPSGRLGSAGWTDSEGSLWLFGGAGARNHPISSYHSSKLLSDVWRFDLDINCWIFTSGSDSSETAGVYGELGQVAQTNFPGARTEMMAWKVGDNLVYIFGGLGYDEMHFGGYLNDLWSADFSAVVSRQYLVSPLILLSFFGVASSLVVAVLVFSLCSRQSQPGHRSRLQFKLSPEYYRLDTDIT